MPIGPEFNPATALGELNRPAVSASVQFYYRMSINCLAHQGVNAPGLPGNWFLRVGLVARKFYCLEANPKGSSLERFPTL